MKAKPAEEKEKEAEAEEEEKKKEQKEQKKKKCDSCVIVGIQDSAVGDTCLSSSNASLL